MLEACFARDTTLMTHILYRYMVVYNSIYLVVCFHVFFIVLFYVWNTVTAFGVSKKKLDIEFFSDKVY